MGKAKMSLGDYIKYPFTQAGGKRALAMLFGIRFGVVVLLFGLLVGIYFLAYISSGSEGPGYSDSAIYGMIIAFGFVVIMLFSAVSEILIFGYKAVLKRNIINGNTPEIPRLQLTQLMTKLALQYAGIYIPTSIVLILIVAMPFALLFFVANRASSQTGSELDAFLPLIMVVGWFVFMIMIFVFSITFAFITKAMENILLVTGSLASAYNPNQIKRYMKTGWKNYLYAVGFLYLLTTPGFFIIIFAYIPCIGIIFYILYFVYACYVELAHTKFDGEMMREVATELGEA